MDTLKSFEELHMKTFENLGWIDTLKSSGCTDIEVSASFADDKHDVIDVCLSATAPVTPYVDITIYIKDKE